MSFTAILMVSRLFALYRTVFLFELCHRLGGQKKLDDGACGVVVRAACCLKAHDMVCVGPVTLNGGPRW